MRCFSIFPAILAVILVTAPAAATVGIGGHIQSQSPDGRRVEVGGACWSSDANILGWVFDWGDGCRCSGYFPTLHRYDAPGDYDITLIGWDDTGATAEFHIACSVPEQAPVEVAGTTLSQTLVGLRPGEFVELSLAAVDEQGESLPMAGRVVEVYCLRPDFATVTVLDSTFVLTALTPQYGDFGWAPIYAYVDGVETDRPLNMISNIHPGEFTLSEGEYFGSFLPDAFFDLSDLEPEEFTQVCDLAYRADLWAVRDRCPNWGDKPQFQGISYAPPLYGCSGNPLGLGDYALPHEGVPKFDVISHEIGHNFHFTEWFFYCIGVPGPFFQETVAEWFVQYALNTIHEDYADQLSAEALGMVAQHIAENQAYHVWEYEQYLSGGAIFDYDQIWASHALVYMIHEYCLVLGWDRLRPFLDTFNAELLAGYADIFALHGGIGEAEHKVTFFLAALSFAMGADLRADFVPLNFPVDDPLFEDLLDFMSASVSVPDDPFVPEETIRILQSWPNPARDLVSIRFVLDRAGPARLALYDLQGRLVRELSDGSLGAGAHQVNLDGRELAMGVYFCRLETAWGATGCKLILLR